MFGSSNQMQAGSFIRFTYSGKKEDTDYYASFETYQGDMYKEVMVLHPNWRNQMHGLDLKRLTPAEVKVLQLIMDPASKDKTHPYPLVNDILRRMDPIEEIKNPMRFYASFVRPFIHGKDVYRRYWPGKMYGLQVIKQSAVEGKITNPAPLFKK